MIGSLAEQAEKKKKDAGHRRPASTKRLSRRDLDRTGRRRTPLRSHRSPKRIAGKGKWARLLKDGRGALNQLPSFHTTSCHSHPAITTVYNHRQFKVCKPRKMFTALLEDSMNQDVVMIQEEEEVYENAQEYVQPQEYVEYGEGVPRDMEYELVEESGGMVMKLVPKKDFLF
ncbi:unnamed protein product [Mytilus edulis]|uniref:Uncharacterized protein n=1 Tax=Mytilus edulis TaxID=6550 RepID=A0A8S3Q496_MYTED|nr:unnamed protein product [Mytilus edulis]